MEVAERREAVQADQQHRQQPHAGRREQQQATAPLIASIVALARGGVLGDLAQRGEDDHRHTDAADDELRQRHVGRLEARRTAASAQGRRWTAQGLAQRSGTNTIAVPATTTTTSTTAWTAVTRLLARGGSRFSRQSPARGCGGSRGRVDQDGTASASSAPVTSALSPISENDSSHEDRDSDQQRPEPGEAHVVQPVEHVAHRAHAEDRDHLERRPGDEQRGGNDVRIRHSRPPSSGRR